MAATFTIVGILTVGFISAIVVYLRKRRRPVERDIFETEYNAYNATGRAESSFYDNDMSSLSGNGLSFPGSYEPRVEHAHQDYLAYPSMGNVSQPTRDSAASNHAGYGSFQRSLSIQRGAP